MPLPPVVSCASIVTPPETLTEALEPTMACVSASPVTWESAKAAVPEKPIEALKIFVSVIAWLRARVCTSRLPVFVGVEAIVPSKKAFVRPATVAAAVITDTARAMLTLTLVTRASAVLVDVASTCTAPAGAPTAELSRTSASVTAALVTCASATLTAPEPSPPIVSIKASTTALFVLLASTLKPAEPAVTLPSTEAAVPPSTLAVGTETPNAAIAPPAATSVCACAKLFDSAVNSTEPLLTIDWLLLPSTESASTFAFGVIRANWMLTPKPASPTAIVRVFASTWFFPVAFTRTLAEPVTLPSSSARTAPPTTARAAKTPAARKPGAVMPSAIAIASLRRFVPFRFALISTVPVDVIDAFAPTFASTSAPSETSALA